MDKQQRFLRRLHLMEHLDILLRESAYHRNYDEEEKLSGIPVWKWDSDEGISDRIT